MSGDLILVILCALVVAAVAAAPSIATSRRIRRKSKTDSSNAQTALKTYGRLFREMLDEHAERSVKRQSTVTTVPPGTVARMRENPAVPSPELRAAVERAHIRRATECPGGEACEC
jgi:hypothetical protein